VGQDTNNNRRHGWIGRAKQGLAIRRGQKPLKKTGQLRALWGESESALDEGQSIESIRSWLEEEGLVLTTATLRSYISRIRKKRRTDAAERFLEAAIAAPTATPLLTQFSLGKKQGEVPVTTEPAKPTAPSDPLAQAREALASGGSISGRSMETVIRVAEIWSEQGG
jgi:hypothetical protein